MLRHLVAAATRAPSAHNRQPWRFRIIRTAEDKARLAAAMGEKLQHDRTRDRDDAEAIRQDVTRSTARITGAPAMIAVCLTLADMDSYPDERRGRAEYLMAVQSTAMAAQNLMLAAHAEGYDSCWMCAPLFCGETVRAALDLPEDWQPQGLVLLGRAAEPGRNRPRRPLSDIVRGIELE